MTESDKHSNLLRCRINYGRKKFYCTGPWSYFKVFVNGFSFQTGVYLKWTFFTKKNLENVKRLKKGHLHCRKLKHFGSKNVKTCNCLGFFIYFLFTAVVVAIIVGVVIAIIVIVITVIVAVVVAVIVAVVVAVIVAVIVAVMSSSLGLSSSSRSSSFGLDRRASPNG